MCTKAFTTITGTTTGDNCLLIALNRRRWNGKTSYTIDVMPVKRYDWGYRYVAPSGYRATLFECSRASKKAERSALERMPEYVHRMVAKTLQDVSGNLDQPMQLPNEFHVCG